MGTDYINKDQIRNLIDYCLEDILTEDKKLFALRKKELETRFGIEFKRAKEYYKKLYKTVIAH